jgi:hypothetical protein
MAQQPDGTVVTRNVEMGQTVAADSETPPLVVIAADLALIHIDAIISAKTAARSSSVTKLRSPLRLFRTVRSRAR